METKNDSVQSLLGNTTDYKSDLLSGNDELENLEGKSVERYFDLKLKSQFEAKNSYFNRKIPISVLLEEFRSYIYAKIFNCESLQKKTAQKILAGITKYFENEPDIEIDSFYPFISGEKIKQFFESTNNCSYPEKVIVNPNLKYTVIVESTYCLKRNVIQKSEQVRKNFLLFSVFSKYYREYREYIEDFYEYFIKKYIFLDKNLKTKPASDYQKDKNFDLSDFENYIILVASNSRIKMFHEVSESIKKSKPFEIGGVEFNLEKCFKFPLYLDSKTPIIEQKKFKEDKEETNNIYESLGTEQVQKDKNKSDAKLTYSYKKLSYLIDNINSENNFKVKLIYLDLYLNVLTPKCEIKQTLENLNKNLTDANEKIVILNANLADANEKIVILNANLTDANEKIVKLEKEQNNTKYLMNILVQHIQKLDPTFDTEKFNIK